MPFCCTTRKKTVRVAQQKCPVVLIKVVGCATGLEFMSELPVWGHLPDQWYQSVFCPFLVFGVAGEAGFENFLFVVNPDDDEWDI